jgi:RHS repeat-associated protein
LGRRVSKSYRGKVTRWVWDGDKPLHEWNSLEVGPGTDAVHDMVTWLFEEERYTPVGKIEGEQHYGILTDHLGTPLQMHDQHGQQVWATELNSYGQVRQREGEATACPFRYQGQYEDVETGLYYNRFRYYDPEVGQYVSQDPLRIGGGWALYGYVLDTSKWIDPFGLTKQCPPNGNLKTFTSDDPYVADLANKIEARYPGHVVAVNKPILRPDGTTFTDFDIETQNAVIQVKSKGKGLANQMARTETVTNKVVIGYGPKLKPSVVKEIEGRGGLVTKDESLLLDVLKP